MLEALIPLSCRLDGEKLWDDKLNSLKPFNLNLAVSRLCLFNLDLHKELSDRASTKQSINADLSKISQFNPMKSAIDVRLRLRLQTLVTQS